MKIFRKLSFVIAILLAVLTFSASAKDESGIHVVSMVPVDAYNVIYVDEDGNEVKIPDSKPKRTLFFKNESVSLPEKYDPRTEGNITFNVRNQYRTGMCWAFSADTCAEIDVQKKGFAQADVDFSEAHLGWFAYNNLVTDPSSSCFGDGVKYDTEKLGASSVYDIGGCWFDSVYTWAGGMGVAPEKSYPTDVYGNEDGEYNMGNYGEADKYVSDYRLAEAEYYDVYRSEELNAMDEADINIVKKQVMEHGAVQCAYWGSSAYTFADDGCYYYQKGTNESNHAVTIIGWDDNIPAEKFSDCDYVPQKSGAWLIQNSWDTDWGENGFFWISYEDPSLAEFTTFSFTDKKFDQTYEYDGYGPLSGIYESDCDEASIANIYECTKDCYAEETGFYTDQDNMVCTVKIYTDVNESEPTSGNLLAQKTQTLPFAGYHTLNLDKKVPIKKGERFSVVVTYKAADGKTVPYIPVEHTGLDLGNYAIFCNSNPGESFCSFGSNGEWMDTSEEFNNVHAKVFVSYADEHDYETEWTVDVEPSCVTEGSKSHHCKTCDSKIDVIVLPATGHKNVVTGEKAPTCSETGLTGETKCSVCGEILKMQEIIPATGKHTDENNDGLCDRCGTDLGTNNPSENCSCICHSKGFSAFIYKLIRIFLKLFKINPVCECGAAHY